MNVALRSPVTLPQFLAWEERQELRYEFDGFQPIAITGGTIGHDRITFNPRKALDVRLAGNPCQPHGPNVKIIADGKVRYPRRDHRLCTGIGEGHRRRQPGSGLRGIERGHRQYRPDREES